MNIELVLAQYGNPRHAKDIVELLDEYARDPMGGGVPLTEKTRENLICELDKRAGAFSVLAYMEDEAVGLVNCFEGFSTFKCKPLINIHDLMVKSTAQGLQISQRMLRFVEGVARERDCCKLTLEVLSGNNIAKGAYLKFGFMAYELDPVAGQALFFEKSLPTDY